ncbi:hypothetical protein E3N88_37752 [Mikania micrantha]|uniref:Uncharacterized protein n=1 Tax=Mikania micrantha TaxID=192012 RepID=A0A5N6LSX3_9ASTR|nr:hypothetical protein E3N88_37752 [Mikania micrantha]
MVRENEENREIVSIENNEELENPKGYNPNDNSRKMMQAICYDFSGSGKRGAVGENHQQLKKTWRFLEEQLEFEALEAHGARIAVQEPKKNYNGALFEINASGL